MTESIRMGADTTPVGIRTVAVIDIGATMTTLSVLRNQRTTCPA